MFDCPAESSSVKPSACIKRRLRMGSGLAPSLRGAKRLGELPPQATNGAAQSAFHAADGRKIGGRDDNWATQGAAPSRGRPPPICGARLQQRRAQVQITRYARTALSLGLKLSLLLLSSSSACTRTRARGGAGRAAFLAPKACKARAGSTAAAQTQKAPERIVGSEREPRTRVACIVRALRSAGRRYLQLSAAHAVPRGGGHGEGISAVTSICLAAPAGDGYSCAAAPSRERVYTRVCTA